jgi:hypothetical protein
MSLGFSVIAYFSHSLSDKALAIEHSLHQTNTSQAHLLNSSIHHPHDCHRENPSFTSHETLILPGGGQPHLANRETVLPIKFEPSIQYLDHTLKIIHYLSENQINGVYFI